MLVGCFTVINAMMVFVRASDDDAPGQNRVEPILNHEGYVSREIDVDLAFGMNVRLKSLAMIPSVGFDVSYLK